MDATNLILKQGWYEEIGKKWHQQESFNKIGEHVTILNLKDKFAIDVEEVFCVRNFRTSVSIKFKDETYYTFYIMNDSLYLDASFDIIDSKTISVKVPLSWYTLSYSYKLIGKKYNKEELLNYD